MQAFVAFLGHFGEDLEAVAFSSRHLVEDKSLFKAQGPVWHRSDREKGRIPEGLRNLDTDATWSKSAYQGWVYGYGVHVTCTEEAFPKLVEVHTASVSESAVIEGKEERFLGKIRPLTLTADNGYCKALRIRRWAKEGVALLTPAKKWTTGRYAEGYHRFISRPENQTRFQKRRTSVEPLFDLVAKAIGADGLQKPLPTRRLDNARTCLALGVLSVQLAMIVNSIWGLPLRNISHMTSAFT